MGQVYNNLSGTTSQSFSIGKGGITVYQGTEDPSVTPPSSQDGDFYIRKGASAGLWQRVSGTWSLVSGSSTLSGLTDVDLTSLSNNDYLRYNFGTSKWENVQLDISTDTTPQLGGNLDVNDFSITSSVADGNISIAGNGTGLVLINSGVNEFSMPSDVGASGFAIISDGGGSTAWEAVVQSITAGDGLSGGTITNSGTIALNITGQTTQMPEDNDEFIFWDTINSVFKKTPLSGFNNNFLSLNGGTMAGSIVLAPGDATTPGAYFFPNGMSGPSGFYYDYHFTNTGEMHLISNGQEVMNFNNGGAMTVSTPMYMPTGLAGGPTPFYSFQGAFPTKAGMWYDDDPMSATTGLKLRGTSTILFGGIDGLVVGTDGPVSILVSLNVCGTNYPTNLGTSGQALVTDGAGTATWTTLPGSGTVTSIDITPGSSKITSIGGPITTSGAITIDVDESQLTLSNFSGSVNLASQVSGTLAVGNGGTGLGTLTDNALLLGNGTSAIDFVTVPVTTDTYLKWNGTAYVWDAGAAGGTVNEIDTGGGLIGGPITTSGTIALDITGQTSQVPIDTDEIIFWDITNSVFKKAVISDISSDGTVTSIDITAGSSKITSTGGPVTSSGAITIDIDEAELNLANIGGDLDLSTQITGTLSVVNGGTGATSLTSNGILLGNGTGAITNITVPSVTDTYLKWNGSAYVWVTVSTGSGTVTEVDTGGGLTGGPITATGTIALDITGQTSGTVTVSDELIYWDTANTNFKKATIQDIVDLVPMAPTRYHQDFNATTDWTNGGGYYSITISATTHGQGLYPIVQVMEGTGPFIITTPDSVSIDTSGNVIFSVVDTPDSRFAGRVTIL